MATTPGTKTVAVGDKVTASDFNTYVRDPGAWTLTASPRVAVTNSVVQAVTTATWTLITWDSEDRDNDSMHSTSVNTSRLTATTAGLYRVIISLGFANNATGVRGCQIRKNATGAVGAGTQLGFDGMAAFSGFSSVLHIERTVLLAAGDTVEAFGYQSSGANLNTDNAVSYFEMNWMGVS